MQVISIKDLLDAGAHFGHKTNRWNPKMSEYLYGHRNGIHIIDLQKTVVLFAEALKIIKDFSSQGKTVLFVGTKRQASDLIEKYAKSCNQFFINKRWLGGILTNWNTIQNSIKRLKKIEDILENHTQSYTKKELLKFQNLADKLNKSIGGIKDLNSKPDLLFIVDTNKEFLAVKEANKSGIPIVAILDSNSNPEGIDYPIPGNDDAIRSIEFYCSAVAETIKNNKSSNQENNTETKV
jgi:small subunit ribosomal protein S2